jgi:hypothetical protein
MLVRQRPVISLACSAATSHSFSTAAAEGLYELLGLDRSASTEDIKSAFRKVLPKQCSCARLVWSAGAVQLTSDL